MKETMEGWIEPHKHIPFEGGHLTVNPEASPELVN
jgi:hypothetical protein